MEELKIEQKLYRLVKAFSGQNSFATYGTTVKLGTPVSETMKEMHYMNTFDSGDIDKSITAAYDAAAGRL